MMDRYPALRLIVRFGAPVAPLVALFAGGLALHLAWSAHPAIAAGLGVVVAGGVWLLAKAVVEIVTILTEMLVPR